MATDFWRHHHEDRSKLMALTDDSICGSAWSEQDAEETSRSTAPIFSGAKKHGKDEKQEKQRQQHIRPSPPPPCVDKVLEDGQKPALSFRCESSKPRRHQWSAMWYVQMSVMVVSLAVAISLTLVFALRNSKDRAKDGSRHSEDDGGDVLVADGSDSFDAAMVQSGRAHFKNSSSGASERTEKENVEQRMGSDSASAGSRGPVMSEPEPTVSSFPVGIDGVVWLEDGTFEYVHPKGAQHHPLSRVDEFDGGRRRHSDPSEDTRAPAGAKSMVNLASPSVGRGENRVASAAKIDRKLQRFDKKDIAKKQELRWLLST